MGMHGEGSKTDYQQLHHQLRDGVERWDVAAKNAGFGGVEEAVYAATAEWLTFDGATPYEVPLSVLLRDGSILREALRQVDGDVWWRGTFFDTDECAAWALGPNVKVRGPEAALSPEAPSRLPGYASGVKK